MKHSVDGIDHSTIHISTGTILRVVCIVLFVAFFWYLRDLVLVVLTAIILASAIEPGVRWLHTKNVPRLLAVVLFYVLGGVFIAAVLYFFVPAFLEDAGALLAALPRYLDVGSFGGVGAAISQSVATSGNVLDLFRENLENGNALRSASVFFGGLLSFVLIIVLSFYLSAQEKGVENFLRLVAPAKDRAYTIDLWRRSQHKIGLWFQGQLILGLLIGVTVFLVLAVLGIPSAIFLAVTAAIFELIPVFGPVLAAVPAVAIAYANGINPVTWLSVDPGVTAGIIIAGVYFVIQQFESHLIYPLVVRKVIGIPPVLVILALVVGGKLAGFLGIILSVPLTAIIMEFLNDIAKERKIFEDA